MQLQSLTRLAVVLAILTSPYAAQQIELPLLNGGFESPVVSPFLGITVGSLSNWTILGGVAGVARYPTGALAAPRGAQTLGMNPGAQVSQVVNVPVTPGHSYSLSFLVRGLNSFSAPMSIEINVDGLTGIFWQNTDFVDNTQYTRKHVTYTHPANSLPGSSLEIVISATNSLNLDDMHLFETPRFAGLDTNFNAGLEASLPGPSFNLTPNSEHWAATFSTGFMNTFVLPDGSNVTGPQLGMPSEGTQWLEVTNVGVGPATNPSVVGAVLDTFAETSRIRFDWTFATTETIGDLQFHDVGRVVFLDASGFLFDQLLIDTADAGVNWVPVNFERSGQGFGFNSVLANVQTTTIDLPSWLIGRHLFVRFEAENLFDALAPSSLFVDNVRFVNDRGYEGTQEGPVLGTGVTDGNGGGLSDHGVLSGGPGNERKSAGAGDVLQVSWYDDSLNFQGRPVALIGQIVSTGFTPVGFPQFGVGFDLGPTTVVLADGLAPLAFGPRAMMAQNGQVRSYVVPTGLSGSSVLLQALVPFSFAGNGIMATTSMHEIVIN